MPFPCHPSEQVSPHPALIPPGLLPLRLIDTEVIPVLKQSSLAGAAEYRTQSPLLERQPQAVDILIDVLSDRGFRCDAGGWGGGGAGLVGPGGLPVSHTA